MSALALVMSEAPVAALQLATQRGGAGAATAQVAAQALASAQQSSAVAQQTMNALTRASNAVQMMQQAQAQARAAAANAASAGAGLPSVPNGLAVGGLVPDSGLAAPGVANQVSSWSGASTPTQSVSNGQTSVNIKQQAAQAILTWQTFNVGRQTTLNFDQQGNSNWVALNRVIDPAQRPSQILGSIKASGQVYVINHNGIVFGGASQINVGALVASTADFNPNVVAGTDGSAFAGADAYFKTDGIYSTQSGGVYLPSFTDAGGSITVDRGAQISTSTPSSVTSGGGFVLLMGAQVTNGGSITTPDGQTELAAGDNFLIRSGYSTSGNSWSTTRGNEIAVQLNDPGSSLAGGSGYVANLTDGVIEATTGDITLVGETVLQGGALLSTTSVNTRGTIHLLSSASDSNSSVTLTGQSVTEIAPDTSGATALNSQRSALLADSTTQDNNRLANKNSQFDDLSALADLEDESRVEIVTGGTAWFQNSSQTVATGGQISVSAASRIQVDTGALLDVAGDATSLAMSANDLAVAVQGNELRDDPNNRDTSILFDDTVYVDERQLTFVQAGTGGDTSDRDYTAGGVFEVSGWLNNTAHTIGEWLASGGSITLSTGPKGAVVAQSGAIFNIAGGEINYQSGYVKQSYLIGSDGNLYNANTAPSDLTYTGIYDGFEVDHNVDGQRDPDLTEYFGSPLFAPSQIYEQGYTVGRDAGSLTLATPTAIFDATVEAGVTDGQDQTTARPSNVSDPYLLSQTTVPLQGAINLGDYSSLGLSGGYNTNVSFGATSSADASAPSVTDAISSTVANTANFDASQISSENLGGLSVATAGAINVNAPLAFAPGAQIRLIAANIDIAANITAPSGNISIGNLLFQAQSGGTTASVPTAIVDANGLAQATIEQGVTLDTEGLWTNGLLDPGFLTDTAFVDGGNVSIDESQGVTLSSGSAINTSSGAAILQSGKQLGGNGGSITLKADDNINGTIGSAPFVLDAMLTGYGVTKGGTLTIESAGSIIVSDQPLLAGNVLAEGQAAPGPVVLAQPLTLQAGTKSPFSFNVSYVEVNAGQSLPVSVTPTFKDNNGAGLLVSASSDGWIVPSTFSSVFSSSDNFYFPGQTVPPGTLLVGGSGSFPAGYVVPADAFPNGIQISSAAVGFAAGAVLSQTLTVPAGTLIPAGAALAQNVSVQPFIALPSSLFSRGFSAYNITSDAGVGVASGTQVNVVEPVYELTPASYASPTGTPTAQALNVWLPPLYAENSATARLTPRAGASLTLANPGFVNGAPVGAISVGRGVAISVDPGQSIELSGSGQITVDGSLTAPGGTIDILDSHQPLQGASSFEPGGLSVWIGSDAVLDVAGRAVTALDSEGRSYGLAPAGGSIILGSTGGINSNTEATLSTDAFIVVRPGAVLDASGASAQIDPLAGTGGLRANGNQSNSDVMQAGAGGLISFSSYSGLYMDGTLEAAAGGVGAAGGTLSVTLETPVYPTFSGSQVGDDLRAPRIITIGQAAAPSALPADLVAGDVDPSLVTGEAHLSANEIEDAGFGTVSLFARSAIEFDGNVSLKVGQAIELYEGALGDTQANGNVFLTAPYVLFDGQTGINAGAFYVPPVTPTTQPASAASLTVEANLIDFADLVDLDGLNESITLNDGSQNVNAPGFADASFVSQGDIRFLPSPHTAAAGFGASTVVKSAGNLLLAAQQLYPTTGATADVEAGFVADGSVIEGTSLTIGRSGDSVPDLPLSVGGILILGAPTVNQGGIVRAPFGQITIGRPQNIGVASDVVNLLPGSITSASGAGLNVLDGGTVDGVTYTGTKPDGTGVTIEATQMTVSQGALIDVSGGGTLAGAGFISGEGGSVNVLATPLVNANPASAFSTATDQVYAILPGFQGYAPIDAANTTNPGVGQQVTIPAGVPGLPAGTYILLPANDALLPGAYRIELNTATDSRTLSGATVLGASGSYVLPAYTGTANTGIKSALPIAAIVTPGSAVRNLSQYDEEDYATFAIESAAKLDETRGWIPADAGTVTLVPTGVPGVANVLTYAGTTNFQPGQGGYGGTLSVFASQVEGEGTTTDLEITQNGVATPGFSGVTLAAPDLDAFGAETILIGGTGTTSFTGTANSVTIAGGAVLSAPQVILVANTAAGSGGITLDPGAVIDTIGYGAVSRDSDKTGILFSTQDLNGSTNLLAASNGNLVFLAPVHSFGSAGPITIDAGASIYSEGSINFLTDGTVSFEDGVRFGTRNLSFSVGTINLGDVAGARAIGENVPVGFDIDQAVLTQLLNGDPAVGAPALQNLILTAVQSVNVIGGANLSTINPTTGESSLVSLVINTPAIYGLGASSDKAIITTNELVWNGVPELQTQATSNALPNTFGSTPPVAVLANGPGTGSGTLDIVANEIVLGYPTQSQPDGIASLDRLMLGFSGVTMNASQEITDNFKGTLSVYASGPSPDASYNAATYAGVGGSLNLVTPLLTGGAGSVLAIRTGGALSVLAPPSGAGSTASTALGAEIDLTANSIVIDTAVGLPSGKLTATAQGDVALDAGANLDLSGRTVPFFDVNEYTWGGAVILQSTDGDIVQANGSTIDVSAVNNNAGSITAQAVSAGAGQVALDGTLLGAATATAGTNSDPQGGTISVDAQTLAGGSAGTLSADFAALNTTLNANGFSWSRTFDLKQGDLTIGNELQAHDVNVSVDNGSLTVDGTINASGATPGSITLAAENNLILNGTLDAHSNVLQVDSYGNPIDAENRATVSLTTVKGTLTLADGATIDVSSPTSGVSVLADGSIVDITSPTTGKLIAPDGTKTDINAQLTALNPGGVTSQGDVELNVPRGTPGTVASAADETLGDAKIEANGTINIVGAQTIALNAFWTYTPTDSAGTIVQDNGDPDGNPVAQGGNNSGFVGLDQIDARSQAFINAAIANGSALRGQITGLLAQNYTDSFHLRPGVEIDSGPSGTLSVGADLDLSAFRYASLNPNNEETGVYGSGEPGVLVIRASGDLNINGSISDGFNGDLNTTAPATFSGFIDIKTSADFAFEDSGFIGSSGNEVKNYQFTGSGLYVAASYTVPNDDFQNYELNDTGAGGFLDSNGNYYSPGSTIPAGALLVDFELTPREVAMGEAPVLATVATGGGGPAASPTLAPMLAPGSLSWSIKLAAGADLTSASTSALMPTTALAVSGNLTLNNASDFDPNSGALAPAVVRTGTGSLELLAGGNISEDTLYGVYTAGTQSVAVGDGEGADNEFQLFTPTPGEEAWYPTDGGNLFVSVQGDLTGAISATVNDWSNTADVGDWLWRQGGKIAGQSTAWYINFGTYESTSSGQQATGFNGFGTLGGGNVTINVGGDAGVMSTGNSASVTQGVVAAVGATGRVLDNGQIVETGGGTLRVSIGGTLNPGALAADYQFNRPLPDDMQGVFTNVRGNTTLGAGAIGEIEPSYQATNYDPRMIDEETAEGASNLGGPVVVPGDGTVTLTARGALVLGGVGDPGRVPVPDNTPYVDVATGQSFPAGGTSWFSLWTDNTVINLMSAGGDVTPSTQSDNSINNNINANVIANDMATDGRYIDPATLNVVAASGSVYLEGDLPVELAPAPLGQLQMLAQNSIYGNQAYDISGAAGGNALPTPLNPAFSNTFGENDLFQLNNLRESEILNNINPAIGISYNFNPNGNLFPGAPLFVFEPDTPTTNLHADDPDPARFYAVTGDIVGLTFGETVTFAAFADVTPSTWYIAAKPAWIRAGRDIVSAGDINANGFEGNFGASSVGDLFKNNESTDISLVEAGRDILTSNFTIAGPGLLTVQAGRNIDEEGAASVQSIGVLVGPDATNRNTGAGISVLAGVGTDGPDYAAFANAYLNPSDPSALLASQRDYPSIVQQDDTELAAWLTKNFGYQGDASGAYAFFQMLPAEQQDVFLRQIFFKQLDAGGKDFNDPTSIHFKSYIIGQDAIATLFPTTDADGSPIDYSGDITLFGASGIHTVSGGTIQTFTPGGETIVGVEGATPPGTAGLLTQGSGDIDMYSLDSILLGESRILTTFGGNIVAWSATGDINAGKGSKTTQVFTPPLVAYDNYGNVTLSPQVPSTGAGIGTLNPIPSIPPGNIDLIAPQGTVDAGEAGIRVSGNFNVAALHVVNTANIEVQGTTTGVPTIVAPNIGALSDASAASGAATKAITASTGNNNNNVQPSILIVEVEGYGGDDQENGPAQAPQSERKKKKPSRQTYNYDTSSPYQVLGAGDLSDSETDALMSEKGKSVGR